MFAYTNEPLRLEPLEPTLATFEVKPRGNPDVVVILALSGGGSRAAYFASEVMLNLERVLLAGDKNLLDEVDAISSVSGGSLPGAYYCSSRDPDDPWSFTGPQRVWKESTVRHLMSKSYIWRWFGNLFWPANIVRYWFTAFDRSDIMAQTFADNLFDSPLTGINLTMGKLNPQRPCLLLNATNATRSPKDGGDGDLPYGQVFSFTREDFTKLLGSEINTYSLARAVMASATFSGVFPDMTLRDYRVDKARFLHVFDGGNSDNLGLVSAKRLIQEAEARTGSSRQCKYIVICVDAYTEPRGVDRDEADPRSFVDRFLDTNFMDSIDALLTANRWRVLLQFIQEESEQEQLRMQMLSLNRQQKALSEKERPVQGLKEWVQSLRDTPPESAGLTQADWEPSSLGERLLFWHIHFDDLQDQDLRAAVHEIPTSFSISDEATEDLERAARALVLGNQEMLDRVKQALEPQPR